MLYLNDLGGYAPVVDASLFGGDPWNPTKPLITETKVEYPVLCAHSVSCNFEEIRIQLSEEVDYESAKKMMIEKLNALGFIVEVLKNRVGIEYIHAIHTETENARLEAQRKREEKSRTGVKGYIRFGDIPENGKSYNYRDGFFEDGVSAYNALFFEDGTYEIISNNDIQIFGSISYAAQSPKYRLYGEQIGLGSDGEPILKVERAERI